MTRPSGTRMVGPGPGGPAAADVGLDPEVAGPGAAGTDAVAGRAFGAGAASWATTGGSGGRTGVTVALCPPTTTSCRTSDAGTTVGQYTPNACGPDVRPDPKNPGYDASASSVIRAVNARATLAVAGGESPRTPEIRTRSGPSADSRTLSRRAVASGLRYAGPPIS